MHPSSIARVIQCPGSWKLTRQFPNAGSSDAAAEGTAAHWVAAELAQGRVHRVNDPTPNGIPVTWEMIEGAEMYIEAIGDGPHHIEERLSPCLDLHPTMRGTPDSWSHVGAVIEINDYKFGHGHVEVFENPQLVTYACMILDQLRIDGRQEQFMRLVFRIIQPRSYSVAGPVRTWSVMAPEIRAMRNRIRAAIVAAQGDNPECRTGDECGYCSARAFCTTLQQATMRIADWASVSTPMELEPAAMGLELRTMQRSVDLLKARLSGLEEVALSTAKSGKQIPGYRIEQGQGRQRWKVPVAAVEALGDTFKIKLTESSPITPKQAITAGIPAELIAQFSETPPGKVKLVQDDGGFLRRVFTQA
jgi:hypothetical protein